LTEWEAQTWRFETAVGYSITRNVIAKGAWQKNGRDGGRVRRDAAVRGHRWSIGSEAPCGDRRPGPWSARIAPAVTRSRRAASAAGFEIRKLDKPSSGGPTSPRRARPGPRDLPDLRRGVVYLETAPRSAFDERDPGHAVMDQRNERFVPHVLAVMVGTIVDFPNSDLIYHNVFSLSRAKRFDLGRYAAGKSKGVRMDRPGVVRVFCDIPLAHERVRARLQSPVLRRHRCRRPLPAALAALRHLHDRRVVRGRGTRHAIGGRPADGWAEVDLVSPVMRVLGSITNRIFLASALLAIISIGAAVYFISSRMTSETEAELQGDLTERRRSSTTSASRSSITSPEQRG
jgi:plastocyanin